MSALSRRTIGRAAARIVPELHHSPAQQRAFFSATVGGAKNASKGGPLPGGTPRESSEQAMPLGPYYETILKRPQPVPEVKPEEPPTTSEKSPVRRRRTTTKKEEKTEGEEKAPPAAEKDEKTKEEIKKKKEAQIAATKASFETVTISPTPATSTSPMTGQEKAQIVFGSRLAGPQSRAARLAALRDSSTMIAGVRVPARPSEPDNCCMSGCVNCVWDRYRDDMEEYALASKAAEKALRAQEQKKEAPMAATAAAAAAQETPSSTLAASSSPAATTTTATSPGGASVGSMDDDGGGSETNWDGAVVDTPKIAKDFWDDDLYKNVPVGIREFMKHEKKLKQKHAQDGTMGG